MLQYYTLLRRKYPCGKCLVIVPVCTKLLVQLSLMYGFHNGLPAGRELPDKELFNGNLVMHSLDGKLIV